LRIFRSIAVVILILTPMAGCAEIICDFQDGAPEWRKFVSNAARTIKATDMADSLHSLLINYGFLDNSILSKSDSSDTIIVKFGGEYYIGNLIVEGDAADIIKIDKHFRQNEYELLIDSMLQYYQNRGFYFANLIPNFYCRVNNRVDIRMVLSAGPVVTVSSVEYEGNQKTRPELLNKYIQIAPGDTLETTCLEQSLRRLNKSGFAYASGYPEILPDAGYQTARIRYNLTEKKQFSIEGAGGYVPDKEGYFIGFINANLWNFFGGGRSIGLLIDSREKKKSVFELLYGQPLFLVGTGWAEIRVKTRDYREQFYEFGISGLYRFNMRGDFEANLSLGWKDLEPADIYFRAFEVYEAGFGVGMRDISRKWKSDFQFSFGWDIQYAARFYDNANDTSVQLSNINETRNVLISEMTFNPIGSMIIYNKFDFRDLNSIEKSPPVSELFLFGGPSDLRGYRNDQFSAVRLLILSLESGFFFSQEDYFYPFIDAAYYEHYESGSPNAFSREDSFMWGYGFGFNLSSDNRHFRLELSWSKDADIVQPRLNAVLSGNF
jgi:outer membrane protein assembly factor BamA